MYIDLYSAGIPFSAHYTGVPEAPRLFAFCSHRLQNNFPSRQLVIGLLQLSQRFARNSALFSPFHWTSAFLFKLLQHFSPHIFISLCLSPPLKWRIAVRTCKSDIRNTFHQLIRIALLDRMFQLPLQFMICFHAGIAVHTITTAGPAQCFFIFSLSSSFTQPYFFQRL